MSAELILGRTAQGVHGASQLGIEVPGIGGVDDVLQLALSCKEGVHLIFVLVVFGQSEFQVDVLIFLQGIDNVLHAFFNNLANRLCIVQLGLLWQVAHRIAWGEYHIALVTLIQSCYDLQQRGLTRSVETYYAYLGTIEEAEINVLQYLFLSLLDGLAYTNH